MLSRYCADGASPVQIDHKQIKRHDARVHDAALLPDTMGTALRHDGDRLARALHEVAAAATRAR